MLHFEHLFYHVEIYRKTSFLVHPMLVCKPIISKVYCFIKRLCYIVHLGVMALIMSYGTKETDFETASKETDFDEGKAVTA